MHLHRFTTLLALNIATPMELAAAPVHHLHLLRLEATAAAHQLAAIDGLGGAVALAAHRSQHARCAWVALAEVWAGLQVDQVLISVRFELGVARRQHLGRAHLALLHLSGAIKLLLDDIAHLAEGRHGPPACLHFAGA